MFGLIFTFAHAHLLTVLDGRNRVCRSDVTPHASITWIGF